MAIKTRILFCSTKGKFFIQRRHIFLCFYYWSTVEKDESYSSEPSTRYFSTFPDAKNYAIKTATDVVLEHKANEYDPLL